MLKRLLQPDIIWLLSLRFIAGYLSALTIIIFSQMVAGHTGSITNLAMNLVVGDYSDMLRVLLIILSFFLGTIASGFIYPKENKNTQRKYSPYFFITGIIFIIVSQNNYHSFHFLAYITFVLGLQNGMFVYYKGLIVRTTILTGPITDIGTAIGKSLRGYDLDHWKLHFHSANVVFYFLGALLGTFLTYFTSWNALIVAGLIDIAIAIFSLFIKTDHTDQA